MKPPYTGSRKDKEKGRQNRRGCGSKKGNGDLLAKWEDMSSDRQVLSLDTVTGDGRLYLADITS